MDFSKYFHKGEYFVYKNGDRLELGMVKRRIDDETYAAYYHMGDTAAHTPVRCMLKLENGGVSPARRILVRDLLEMLPEYQWIVIYSDSGDAVSCMKEDVPNYFLLHRIEGIRMEWERVSIVIKVSVTYA